MTENIASDPRITALGMLIETHAGLTGRIGAQVAKHRLSLVEFEILMRLARSPGEGLRMSHLAAQTSLSTSGITRVVDRLERDGLVCRRACASDRRSWYAVITEAGKRRLDETLPGHLKIIEQWFTGQLEATELQQLLALLRKVRDAVHPGATAGSTKPAQEPQKP